MSLHTWHHQGPCKPSSCATFTLNFHWGRAATGKKILVPMHEGSFQSCLTLCDPVDCSLQAALSGRGVPEQEFWSVWANTGFHTLLYFLLH